MHRVQVKYGGAKKDGAIVVTLSSSYNGSTVLRSYSKEEIDALVIYLPDTDDLVWLEAKHVVDKKAIQLRREKPKNNQKKGIWMVEDFIW